MNLEANGGRKARIVEIVISVLASAIGSAGMALWFLSATFASINAQLARHEEKISANMVELRNLAAHDSLQATQLAVADARFEEILRRLQSLDDDNGRNR